ncbi:phosphoribosylglycinamide formyltransferase [Proteocatella sphenisci]|uniref:phosphoribosylglycinamide formyltransferase n=1 Tax=Proteocatella sphenisci TaxID=181070 RepID=UPI0004B3AEEB|nr:phosphoribosylglycinamide formyltransferase [Proteocatella sphenisci]
MRNNSLRIAVLVSGSGSNLQALIDAQKQDYFLSEIKIVISNKADSFALKRAEDAGIKTYVIKDNKDLRKLLIENDIDLIVLAGYLKIVSEEILEEYENRIINIHPSLLPKYGGRGMYGINVHRAVFESGDKESGATVHKVTNVIDGGEIIMQNKTDISDCKSAEEIQKKVLKIEHQILKNAIKIMESNYKI